MADMTRLPRVVLATRNAKKAREMEEILRSRSWEIVSLLELDPNGDEVEETGDTYDANALIKARAAARTTGLVAIADDAGLEIDALGGQPGVHSHRFLGVHTSFPEKMRHILDVMRNVPDSERGCRFKAAVALVDPQGREHVCWGVCEGRVAHEIRGEYGFGYDPVFYLPELGKHMAELTPQEKHVISHRGKALACARKVLADWFSGQGEAP